MILQKPKRCRVCNRKIYQHPKEDLVECLKKTGEYLDDFVEKVPGSHTFVDINEVKIKKHLVKWWRRWL